MGGPCSSRRWARKWSSRGTVPSAQGCANISPASLANRDGLYAAMAFTEACREAGVQPIIGTMLAVARPGGRQALDWLALYAQNDTGYDNLCALVSQAHLGRPVEDPAHVTLKALEG